MTYDNAVKEWIARRGDLDASLISEVAFWPHEECICGEGTCFQETLDLSFVYDGDRYAHHLSMDDVTPGQFVQEVAGIWMEDHFVE